MTKRTVLCFLCLVGLTVPLSARGQDEEKIQKLFQDAIQAMGGDTYLNVKDMTSEGNYFLFNREGDSSGLIKYTDYTKLPDKSRFELGNKKKARDITVFNLEKNEGWILEYPKEVRAATPSEMKEFRNDANHSIDNIMRFRWKDPANKLFYLGPGDGSEVTLEMVKILNPENDEVTVYFDRMSKLPAKIEYRSVSKQGVQQRNVQEFSQWVVVQGVNTPLRVDGYINKRQSFQSFITKIDYNTDIPDSFFTKPEQPK
jgi:outer membrane lipoprotein-sorting protein